MRLFLQWMFGGSMLALGYSMLVDREAIGQVAVELASEGRALIPIVVAEQNPSRPIVRMTHQAYGQRTLTEVAAGQAMREHAQTLATQLHRIVGAPFAIETGDGQRGIVVGLLEDFPHLNLGTPFDPADAMRTEEYLIRTHADGVYLIGASDQAVQHAIWDFLFALGYRQFFPSSAWEIVPQRPELSVAIDRFEAPDYHSRLIWYGSGMADYNEPHYQAWFARNRQGAGFNLNTSHEYNAIRTRHAEAFRENPQFLAQIDGEHRPGAHAKLNVAEPDLQTLVVEDALNWFSENPLQMSKSMDPSDFGGWSNTGPSAELGEGTNQALTLTNRVAWAAQSAFQTPRYIGMYAYYQHQKPPTIQIEPNVIVSFATRFLRPGQLVDDLIAGWKAQGLEQVGIREYYGVYMWDWGSPDLSLQGGDLAYLQYTIPHFFEQGARFLTSESSDAWGSIGLGHYLASRLLWDVREGDRLDALVEDFLENAFGPAAEPMGRFYALINGEDRLLLQEQMVERMYALLAEARPIAVAADRPDVRRRIDELVLYTRYVELMRAYQVLKAADQPRQDAFEAVIRHAYRMKDTMMVHVTALYARGVLARFDRAMQTPSEAAWSVPEESNPWKDASPFTDADIQGWLAAAAPVSRPVFTRVAEAAASGSSGNIRVRDGATYLIHAEAGQRVALQVRTSALGIAWGPAYRIVAPDGAAVDGGRLPVAADTPLAFEAPVSGTYRLFIEPTINATLVRSDAPVAVLADAPLFGRGYVHLFKPRGTLYFRVPAGVAEAGVRVMGQGAGELLQATLLDASGAEVATRDRISGTEPHDFLIRREPGAPAETWAIRVGPPSEGYFEDVYLLLSPELVPVVSADPRAVFEFSKP